jgi:hypothetical protein
MSDNTVLNPGSGGDTVRSEDVGAGVKIPASKIYTGAHGTDGGPVTTSNALPVQISQGLGSQVIASSQSTVQAPTLHAGTTDITVAGWEFKASAGSLFTAIVGNGMTTTCFLMFFDGAPVAGAQCTWQNASSTAAAAHTTFGPSISPFGFTSSGWIVWSTTADIYTAPTRSGNSSATAHYC